MSKAIREHLPSWRGQGHLHLLPFACSHIIHTTLHGATRTFVCSPLCCHVLQTMTRYCPTLHSNTFISTCLIEVCDVIRSRTQRLGVTLTGCLYLNDQLICHDVLISSYPNACVHGKSPNSQFVGAFSQSRKAPVSFVMSDHPSVSPQVSTRRSLDLFCLNLMLQNVIKKSVVKYPDLG